MLSSCLEKAQENVATAGIASLAAVVVLILGLVGMVACQYANNRKLKRRLKTMQHQSSVNESGRKGIGDGDDKGKSSKGGEGDDDHNHLEPLKTKAYSQ